MNEDQRARIVEAAHDAAKQAPQPSDSQLSRLRAALFPVRPPRPEPRHKAG